jgi:hypothetical protein
MSRPYAPEISFSKDRLQTFDQDNGRRDENRRWSDVDLPFFALRREKLLGIASVPATLHNNDPRQHDGTTPAGAVRFADTPSRVVKGGGVILKNPSLR